MSESKRQYLIRAVSGEPDWSSIPQLAADHILWRPDCGIRAFGQLCHDAEHLYVHLRAVEAKIRAEYTAPLSKVCQDSCLEFFFMPEGGDRYFNFESIRTAASISVSAIIGGTARRCIRKTSGSCLPSGRKEPRTDGKCFTGFRFRSCACSCRTSAFPARFWRMFINAGT